jgi:Leucine-rich repeat (LRR) protein
LDALENVLGSNTVTRPKRRNVPLVTKTPFTDANLAACVVHLAAVNNWQTVDAMTQLACPEKNISDLFGLEYLTGLTQLDLRKNQISDLSPLASLTTLSRVRLNNNQISNVSDSGFNGASSRCPNIFF